MNYNFDILLFECPKSTLWDTNTVENFVQAMDYEVNEFVFSECANLIADFFDRCCNCYATSDCDRNCNLQAIEKFENNKTVEKVRVLVDMKGSFKLRKYLNDRIFSRVQDFKEIALQQQLEKLEQTFENSENISLNNKSLEKQFKLNEQCKLKTCGKITVDSAINVQSGIVKDFWKNFFENKII